MEKELRILMVEDVPHDAELEIRELKRAGLRVVHRLVETEEAFRAALQAFQPELIISDFSMPHFDGMFALALARELAPDVPFIFVSGTIGEEYAIRALKNGATDYVLKNNLVRLPAAVERSLEDRDVRAARRRAEEEIQRQRAFLRQVIDLDRNRIFAKDREGRFVLANQTVADAYGRSVEEMLGKTSADLASDLEQAERSRKIDLEVMDGLREVFIPEQQMTDAAGKVRWFQVTKRPLVSADGRANMVLAVGTDITERKLQELRISRLNRTLSVLSGINSAIVRIHDRQQLFEEACRIAVEHGNFGMAWVSEFDPVTLDVTPVAYGGTDASEFVRSKTTARADVPLGQGVVGRAIRAKDLAIVNDLTADPIVGSAKRREAIRRGFRSVIALPLLVEGAVFGALTLYAREPDFFDEEELKLLRELAGDISFALEFIQQQHKIIRLSRIHAVLSGINSAILRVRDRQELFEEACRIAVEHGGFGIAWIGMLDRKTLEIVPAASAGVEADSLLARSRNTASPDSPQGKGVVGRAIREKRAVFSNDLLRESTPGGERRKEAIRRGYYSVIALPLLVGNEAEGTISLFARELNFFDDEEIKLLTELAGDISFALENMARQQQLEKLSRIRSISSEVNAAIVRIHEREALLRETCRIASEHGKFELVWVGLLDEESRKISPVAWTGFSPEAAHAVTWATIAAARGTLGEAIRIRKLSVRNDIEQQSAGGRLRREALEKGCRSNICLPLLVDDRVAALITLFAAGLGFFDRDEIALLDELAADVSFALQSISRQEKLEYLSYYDALTGLPNRQLFVDRLSQQMRARSGEPRMVALILLDIERLRNINETLGRHGGDELLRLVARRLEHAFNGPDYIARISADSFGAVIRGVRDAVEIAHAVENQVLACFREPFLVNDKELRVAAKTGIAMFPADGQDADTLFKNAEAALRKAKESGERFLFYTAEMNAQAAQSLSLETRLRKAVEAQQFVLHYQPKVELASGKVCGLEALIRWNDPETGLVPPGSFIPLLEDTGLILEVGRWALAQALADYREWTARGRAVPRIAVNVSAIQLQQKDFVDTVIDVVRQAGGIPQALELEITESLLMKDIEASIHKLSALRELGIHVAMDDFGTGYSSLSYLARLSIDMLKIDRSFINGMTVDGDGTAIVSTIITLAHSLNLRVVAEGVETEAQAKLLRLLKCDEMQGYLFSRPLPAAEVEARYLAATVA